MDIHFDAAGGLPIRLGDVLQTGLVVTDLQRSMEAYWKLLAIGPWKIYTYAPPPTASTRPLSGSTSPR